MTIIIGLFISELGTESHEIPTVDLQFFAVIEVAVIQFIRGTSSAKCPSSISDTLDQ